MRKIKQNLLYQTERNAIKVTVSHIYKLKTNTIIYKQPDLTKQHFKSAVYASVANFFVTKKVKATNFTFVSLT